jgi:competence protein ComEC
MWLKLKAKITSAWFVSAAAFGVLAGLALAFLAPTFFSQTSWLILSLALFIIAMIGRMRFLLFLALVAGLILGLWRGSYTKVSLQPYEFYIGQTVSVQGIITQDPVQQSGQQQLQIGDVRISKQALPGQIWVSAFSNLKLKRSDQVEILGKLKSGFGSFPASMSFAKIKKANRISGGDVALQIRDKFASGVHRSIQEPEASLGLGYLVGQKRTLPKDLTDNLRIVGLTHVVVASGYNLTILVRLTRRLFAKISKYLAALSASTMTFGFMLVTGFSPSMSRAGLVTGLSLAAWYYAGGSIHWFYCHCRLPSRH